MAMAVRFREMPLTAFLRRGSAGLQDADARITQIRPGKGVLNI